MCSIWYSVQYYGGIISTIRIQSHYCFWVFISKEKTISSSEGVKY